MKLDQRLTEHFTQSSSDLTGPPGRLDVVISAGQSRSPLGKLTARAGVLGIAAIAAVALAAAVTGLSGRAGSIEDDEPSRIVVSPYLATESRMRTPADQVLFTVTTDTPSYWRLASLDVYDDHIWKLKADFNQGLPELDTGTSNGDETLTIHQDFNIVALGEIWLPTAPEPVIATAAANTDIEITADPVNRNLAVPNDRQDSDGLQYSVVSQVVRAPPDELRAVPPVDVGSIRAGYLSTSGFPAATGELATELTVGMSNDYDRLIAIRDHLRSFELDNSNDDNNAPPPSDTDVNPTERFLDTGRGSAMDFASSFAMMARELGIPSRLAVGFTAGQVVEPDLVRTRGEAQILPAAGFTTFEVSNRHAHAWPEVYFEGIGWLAFEPTPDLGS